MAHDYRDQAHDAALAFMAKRGLVGYVTWSAQALGDHFLPPMEHEMEQASRALRRVPNREGTLGVWLSESDFEGILHALRQSRAEVERLKVMLVNVEADHERLVVSAYDDNGRLWLERAAELQVELEAQRALVASGQEALRAAAETAADSQRHAQEQLEAQRRRAEEAEKDAQQRYDTMTRAGTELLTICQGERDTARAEAAALRSAIRRALADIHDPLRVEHLREALHASLAGLPPGEKGAGT